MRGRPFFYKTEPERRGQAGGETRLGPGRTQSQAKITERQRGHAQQLRLARLRTRAREGYQRAPRRRKNPLPCKKERLRPFRRNGFRDA